MSPLYATVMHLSAITSPGLMFVALNTADPVRLTPEPFSAVSASAPVSQALPGFDVVATKVAKDAFQMTAALTTRAIANTALSLRRLRVVRRILGLLGSLLCTKIGVA